MPRPLRNPARPAATACRLLALGLALSQTACQLSPTPLGRVDRRIERLIDQRSQQLGDETLGPNRAVPRVDQVLRESMDRYDPDEDNPSSGEIDLRRVDQAARDLEVADRLNRYAANALGVGEGPDGEAPGPVLKLDLPGALRQMQLTGREFRTAEEQYILTAIDTLQVRHLFSPRFFNDTSLELSGFGDEGRFEHAAEIINTLRVTQRLPDGGSLSASWIVAATDQLRDQVGGGYEQASSIALTADIPLLRGAGPAAREDRIQAERNLIYAARNFERSRRQLLVTVAGDYFSLIQLQASINNQIAQVEGLDRLLEQTEAQVEAGRETLFRAALSENSLLNAQSQLASLRENYILALDAFKIRLGIPLGVAVEIQPLDFELGVPEVTTTVAVKAALDFRLDLQVERDQLDDQRRAVRNARNNILPDLNIGGSLTIPTPDEDPTGGLDIDGEELSYTASVLLSLPLDREIERLELRSQLIGLQQDIRGYQQFRDNLILSARQAVRVLDLSLFQLELAERSVDIAELRLQDQELRDDVDAQSLVDTQNVLLGARNAREAALNDLRTAVLDFLLETGQLRVSQDGTLLPPPGLAGATTTLPAGEDPRVIEREDADS